MPKFARHIRSDRLSSAPAPAPWPMPARARGGKRRRAAVAVVAVVGLLALGACGGGSGTGGKSEADLVIGSGSAQATLKLIHPGTLTVCSEASYPPFENTVDGKMVGFDIDIAQGVADQIGKGTTVTSVATEFNSIESGAALDTGACDLLASALSITSARKAKFDFSDPYYQADTGILVMDPSLTSAAALKGKKVACQIGTTGMTWAKDQGLDVVEFANLGMQVQSMKQGDVQAVINDSEVLTPFVGQDSMRIGFTVTGDKFGLGIAKGNDALREVANQAIAQMRADGRYDQLIKKWFVDASASPTAGDTAENGSAAPVSSPSN